MKQLFDTYDLEAEIFSAAEPTQEMEYDLEVEEADGFAGLTELSAGEMDEFPALELSLSLADGRMLEYEIAAVFVHEEQEYIALHPKADTDGLIHIMQLQQGEDDAIELLPIAGEEELQTIYDRFYALYADDFADSDGGHGEKGKEADDQEDKKSSGFRARKFRVR